MLEDVIIMATVGQRTTVSIQKGQVKERGDKVRGRRKGKEPRDYSPVVNLIGQMSCDHTFECSFWHQIYQ